MTEKNITCEEILGNWIQSLVIEQDLTISINQFLRDVGEYYLADRVYIFEFDFKKNVAIPTYAWGREGIKKEMIGQKDVPMENFASWIDRFEDEGEVCLEEPGNCWSMAMPLYRGKALIGLVGADGRRAHAKGTYFFRLCAGMIMERFYKRDAISMDKLTGLKNYNQYIEDLDTRRIRESESIGVIFIDINGMKKINHSYGYEYGNEKLIVVAQVLRKVLSGDAYRIGGDTFAVLYVNIEKNRFLDKVALLQKKIIEESGCGISVGYGWEKNKIDFNSLFGRAEEMMDAEKQKYYAQLLAGEQKEITGALKGALGKVADDRFCVYYQPQIELETNCVVGAEALIRKIDEEGNLISPNKFIPYYEAEGIIRHIDFFVLQTVCKDMKRWAAFGLHPQISINISRQTLMEPDILKEILDVCKFYDVRPSAITLEVTESIEKITNKELYALVTEFSKAGFEVSLDDFGSKYSNLSLLTKMYFDEIKIDKSLVENIENNPKSQIVVKYISSMCRELGKMRLLAEGIETREQKEKIQYYRYEYGQGFYFYHPMPYEKFDEVLKTEYLMRC